MRRMMFVLGVAAIALAGTGCKKKSGGGTGGGGAWLVGEDGVMENLQIDGTLGEGYSLGVDHDLLSITCRGPDTAFVAGEGGTVLRTFDGGETWDQLDLGTTATLRDVAGPRGTTRLYIVGDDAAYLSRDDGDSWWTIPSSERSWLSVATAGDGARALMLDTAGDVWAYDDVAGGFLPATSKAGLRALAISPDGAHAAAVGDGGALLVSDDAGATWTERATGTGAALHAAWVTESGVVLAVGDDGVVVRAAGADVEVTAPATGTLRAVHLDDAGHGLVAGDVGSLLQTHDGGETWEPLELTLGGAIYALDEVDGSGHL